VKRRVVISGCGVVTPIGHQINEFWSNLVDGVCAGNVITAFNIENYSTKIAAEIFDLDITNHNAPVSLETMDTFSKYAMLAALECYQFSELHKSKVDLSRLGVIVGSSNGGDDFIQQNHINYLKDGEWAISSEKHIGGMMNSVPSQISKTLQATGPSWAISTACASGTNAIGEAVRMIQSNETDMMIAGGTDDGIKALNMAGLDRVNAMTRRNESPKESSRPFDKSRDGFLMGAGAGMIMLEEYEHALNRDAPILAEIVGYGATSDAHHITAPDPEGRSSAKAMRKAIKEAGIRPENIDYINSHGTGTKLNDQMEAKVIHKVFQDYGETIPVNAIKSMTGHMLGGSGAVETIATVLSLNYGIIPATKNCDHMDPSFNINLIRNESIKKPLHIAMTNSFGFGGHNASIILRNTVNSIYKG